MKSTTLDDKTEKVGITLPIVLVKQTDKARGDAATILSTSSLAYFSSAEYSSHIFPNCTDMR
jgi:hypothetical protein